MKKFILTLSFLSLTFGTNQIYAWTEPGSSPPNGNVPTPLRTEADPLVPASIKDGISWSELTGSSGSLSELPIGGSIYNTADSSSYGQTYLMRWGLYNPTGNIYLEPKAGGSFFIVPSDWSENLTITLKGSLCLNTQPCVTAWPAGPQGPAGTNGTNGTNGVAGPKGDKGDTGATGATGAAGAAGAKGDKGDTGATGATGAAGAAGAKGDKGDKGDTGSTGATGSTGSQGPAGVSPFIQSSSFIYYTEKNVTIGNSIDWGRTLNIWGTFGVENASGGRMNFDGTRLEVYSAAAAPEVQVIGELYSSIGKFYSGSRGNTWNKNYYLSLQSDRNMVLYDNNTPLWASNTAVSDIRFKKDIKPMESVLDNLGKLSVIRFHYKDALEDGNQSHIGVIAQEVEKDFPEFVYTAPEGSKLVRYEQLTSVLIKAVQELKAEKDKLKADNNDLRTRIEAIEKKLK